MVRCVGLGEMPTRVRRSKQRVALVTLLIGLLALSILLVGCTPTESSEQSNDDGGSTPTASEQQEEPPKRKPTVVLKLGKRTTLKAGDLGQPVTSYFMKIDIGTPPKPFEMLVDVNAREIFVPHYSKLGYIYTRLRYQYGYAKDHSSTSKKEEAEFFTVPYGGCTLQGKAYVDLFRLPNATNTELVYQQRFLAMSYASNDRFTRFAVDGVMALNPWSISATGSELMTAGLARADLIKELKFALYLKDPEGGPDDQGGELTIGGVNEALYEGELKFHKVDALHSWELHLAGIMLGAHTIGESCHNCTALISSRINEIVGPAGAIIKILRLLEVPSADISSASNSDGCQSKMYEVNCEKRSSGPNLSFIFEDAHYSIPPSAYIKQRSDGIIFKSSTCYLTLISNTDDSKWELGTSFLTNFYTVFNINHRGVALGKLNR